MKNIKITTLSVGLKLIKHHVTRNKIVQKNNKTHIAKHHFEQV
jgi:hypothetical protein